MEVRVACLIALAIPRTGGRYGLLSILVANQVSEPLRFKGTLREYLICSLTMVVFQFVETDKLMPEKNANQLVLDVRSIVSVKPLRAGKWNLHLLSIVKRVIFFFFF